MVLLPQRVLWFGPWAGIHSAESLALCTDPAWVIERLIPQAVTAGCTPVDAPVYALPPDAPAPTQKSPTTTARLLSRVLVRRSPRAEPFPLRLRLWVTTADLVLDALLPERLPPRRAYVLHLQYDLSVYREVIFDAAGRLTQTTDKRVTVALDGAGYHVQMPLSWRELPSDFRREGRAYFLFTVARRKGPGSPQMYDPVLTLPLQVTWPAVRDRIDGR
jgi:hypothetical protein